MNRPALRILQVNTLDHGGGAEKVATGLLDEYRRRGYDAWLAVGRKRGDDPHVFEMPHSLTANRWSRAWWKAHARLQPLYARGWGGRLLCRATHALAAPRGWLGAHLGHEDFDLPGAWHLLDAAPDRPTVLHCHNLHTRYFDLRALAALSRRVPVFVTLHDAWLLAGHCAHSFDCDRWETGCGACPALDAYPAIRRDASAFNWQRKRDIYAQCRLHVAAPCRWLLDRVKRSILAPALADARVIPYGIDLNVFRPGDRAAARRRLGLPRDATVLLFAANGIRANPYKDYATLRAAVIRLAEKAGRHRTIFLGLGESAPPETIGKAEIRFIPFQTDPSEIARYYRAADVYLHAARVDTFPNAVLEALACGTPVVATHVGGIPEQIRPAAIGSRCLPGVSQRTAPDDATGLLVRPGDPSELADAVSRILSDSALARRMGENAACDAVRRFDIRRQADTYLDWYAAVARQAGGARSDGRPREEPPQDRGSTLPTRTTRPSRHEAHSAHALR